MAVKEALLASGRSPWPRLPATAPSLEVEGLSKVPPTLPKLKVPPLLLLPPSVLMWMAAAAVLPCARRLVPVRSGNKTSGMRLQHLWALPHFNCMMQLHIFLMDSLLW